MIKIDKKYILLSGLTASILLNVFLGIKFLTPDKPVRLAKDTRQSVPIKEEHRQFVMAEMRTFVESLQQIRQGLAEDNPERIIAAGKRSGISVSPPKELRESLPQGFLQMGGPTHRLFEAIADSTLIHYRAELVEKQFDQLLNRCVACHKTYRFN